MCLFAKSFSHQRSAQEDSVRVLEVEPVCESPRAKQREATPVCWTSVVLCSSYSFHLPLIQWSSVKTGREKDHLLWDHRLCWAGRNTCFETAFFQGFVGDSYSLFPIRWTAGYSILYSLPQLSFTLFNFYKFPSPLPFSLPGGVSSTSCFTQARNYFGNILPALSHKELNITLKGNLKSFTSKILWHSVCFSRVKKFIERMRGSIGIAFDFLLENA